MRRFQGTPPISITDRRAIAFDARALVRVVAGLRDRVSGIGLPPTEPTGVLFDPETSRVAFCYAEGSARVTVAANRLGALLVSYCIRTRIPVPRYPEKNVRVEPDAIVIEWTTYLSDVKENP